LAEREKRPCELWFLYKLFMINLDNNMFVWKKLMTILSVQ